jgi:hypothetical protein
MDRVDRIASCDKQKAPGDAPVSPDGCGAVLDGLCRGELPYPTWLATSLASGAVYARGGGMGGGNASSADHSQQQTQQRTQKRDGSQSGDARRNAYRYKNREQVRSENTLPSMQ